MSTSGELSGYNEEDFQTSCEFSGSNEEDLLSSSGKSLVLTFDQDLELTQDQSAVLTPA